MLFRSDQAGGGLGPTLFLCLRLAWVYLSRRADQVSDRQERAHANENCHADGEHKPDKFNFLGVEAKAAHCSFARELRLRPPIQARHWDGEKAAGRRMVGGPALDFCPAPDHEPNYGPLRFEPGGPLSGISTLLLSIAWRHEGRRRINLGKRRKIERDD